MKEAEKPYSDDLAKALAKLYSCQKDIDPKLDRADKDLRDYLYPQRETEKPDEQADKAK